MKSYISWAFFCLFSFFFYCFAWTYKGKFIYFKSIENNVRTLIEAFTSSPLFSFSHSLYLCLSQRVNLDEREAVVTLATLADLYVIFLFSRIIFMTFLYKQLETFF